MGNTVTIVDMARELKIAPSTISRALRDHSGIKEETKVMVKELAKKLGYQPNTLALSLLHKKTNNIGIIVPEITSYFFSSIICGVQDVLEPEGQHILISQSNESHEAELKGIETFLSSRVDGLLISSAFNTNDYSHLEKLKINKTPFVIFDRDCENEEMNKVVVDDYDGACQAVEHLITQGCKRIAHICGAAKLSISRHRKKGYIDTLSKHGIEIEEQLIVGSEYFQMEDGEEAAKRLIDLANPPDGIFAVNDSIAIGAMSVLREKGIPIPKEIAIVGFDNNPHSRYTHPPLTTIDQPMYEIGMLASRVLLHSINSGENPIDFCKEILKAELIIRNSSQRFSSQRF